MTLAGSAFTLFDSHFETDRHKWERVDALSINWHDSETKQEQVSDEPAALKIVEFQKDSKSKKEGLTKFVARMDMLTPLALLSDRNDVMQERFLRSDVRGTECVSMQKHPEQNKSVTISMWTPYFHR